MPDSGGKASSERQGEGKSGLHPVARALKLIGAFGVIGIGAYAVLSEQGYVATDNAVVSAYLFAVRSPIEGYVSGITGHVGQEVHAGELLASVENPRVDAQRLADLRSHLRRVQADRASAARQLAYLIELRDALLAKAEDHGRATTEKLEAEAEGVRKSLEAKTSERDQAKADFILLAVMLAGRGSAVVRALCAALCIYLSCRYVWWRVTASMPSGQSAIQTAWAWMFLFFEARP